ncbi:unnamed protein product [Rotaria magnacalcarata]|uniref:MULE transposase domain-containing protein n=1 Tax=Rotaria magnacalcarata TaxID=392030 RepID=A0A8S2TT04_9BILA|nr:unnamed protein product [Rotaria magnacalcarata]
MSSEVHRIPTLRIRHRFLDPESNRTVSDCRIFPGSYRIRYRISRPGIHTNCTHTILLHENDNHIHPGNPVSTEIRIFEEKIRHRALNSNEATQNVIDYCLTNLSDNAVAHLPEISHDKTFNLIPDKLTTTKRNSLFLQFDSGSGNDRIIIFASAEQLQILENCEQLLVDGTFKLTPSIFYQLYAMHVVYRNTVLPVVFALLPNKTQQTYRRLIDKLSEICPSWSPKFIMMDFEHASINVFSDKFVTTTNSSITQVNRSGPWILQEPAGKSRKNLRFPQENIGNQRNVEAVFRPEIFRTFSG